MSTIIAEYEYAGFMFYVYKDEEHVYALAKPGQHRAAYKDKHSMAALECWIDDGRPGELIMTTPKLVAAKKQASRKSLQI
jgi:hypothetical protein